MSYAEAYADYLAGIREKNPAKSQAAWRLMGEIADGLPMEVRQPYQFGGLAVDERYNGFDALDCRKCYTGC
jgi:hypothetical protein